jgi:hypothetical protein
LPAIDGECPNAKPAVCPSTTGAVSIVVRPDWAAAHRDSTAQDSGNKVVFMIYLMAELNQDNTVARVVLPANRV